jgi:hypothetical protein
MMSKSKMSKLTTETLTGMREITSQELEKVSGGTGSNSCKETQALGFFIGCPSLFDIDDWRMTGAFSLDRLG